MISTNQLRAMLAQETGEVFLMCVTISHPSFTDPYRLVTNTQPITRTAGVFEPFAFSLNLPSESDDSAPQVQMSVDNVDNSILLAVRGLPPGARPGISIEVVTASEPDSVIAGPDNFKILSIDYDEGTVNATVGLDDDIINTAFPAGTYTPTNSPGLFA